jgi:CHASE2 domain-containing sensor protein
MSPERRWSWREGARWSAHKLRQFWPLAPLVTILVALMLSDLGDFMGYSPFGSDPCALSEIDQSSFSAKMYLPLARWALRYTPTPSVAIVYIDPKSDPPDLLTNTCASRAFLGRLVKDLNAMAAHVIVIDKFYTAGACAEQDKNAAFVSALESSRAPVVVGQQTYGLSDSSGVPGCLALSPRLEFSNAAKVLYGLTRLNNDDLKIPLRWPVFSDPASGGGSQPSAPAQQPRQLADASGDTLALVAAKVVDPNIESNPSVAKLLAKQIDPYTTFLNLPHITALTAMCSVETPPRAPIEGQPGDEVCAPWVRPLDNLNGGQLSLDSKIVAIGEISDGDMHEFPTDLAPFPPKQRPGVFLHANYIQALLDHRFLEEIPVWLTVTGLVVFVIGVYCLYWSHDAEGKPHLSAEQAGLGSLVVLAGLVLVSLTALLGMSLFTPLWALWGAGVFVVFRYLEASGHHRAQHLLVHLTGHRHPHAADHVGGEAQGGAKDQDERKDTP